MTKTKWLTLSIDKSIPQIADLLHSGHFARGHSAGFELTDVKRNSIRGKFIEEIISHEVVTDPFGDEILNVFRRYLIFEFQIIPSKAHCLLIRISSPPRSLKTFVNSLSNIFGFGFTIEPLNIDILEMIKRMRSFDRKKLWRVKKVRMSSVRLSDTSLAKIDVMSEKDAYQDLRTSINTRGGTLERAIVELNEGGSTNEIELSHTGVIAGDPSLLETLAPMFHSYFD